MVSFQPLKDGYERSCANLKTKPARADEIRKEANRPLKGKSCYQQIEREDRCTLVVRRSLSLPRRKRPAGSLIRSIAGELA